jgi:hypothetical protein
MQSNQLVGHIISKDEFIDFIRQILLIVNNNDSKIEKIVVIKDMYSYIHKNFEVFFKSYSATDGSYCSCKKFVIVVYNKSFEMIEQIKNLNYDCPNCKKILKTAINVIKDCKKMLYKFICKIDKNELKLYPPVGPYVKYYLRSKFR